jgi:hypothetical protein
LLHDLLLLADFADLLIFNGFAEFADVLIR